MALFDDASVKSFEIWPKLEKSFLLPNSITNYQCSSVCIAHTHKKKYHQMLIRNYHFLKIKTQMMQEGDSGTHDSLEGFATLCHYFRFAQAGPSLRLILSSN